MTQHKYNNDNYQTKELECLLQNKEYDNLAEKLSEIALNDFSKCNMWDIRKIFFALPDEICHKYITVCAAVSLLYDISGDTERCEKYAQIVRQKKKYTSPKSREYKLVCSYIAYLGLALPQTNYTTPLNLIRSIAVLGKGEKNIFPRLSVNANLPSVINGGRDFTEYSRYIKKILPPLRAICKKLFGDNGIGIPEVGAAECLYLDNKLYDALVMIVSIIPLIEQKGDINILFAAMYIQMCIMISKGQMISVSSMADKIKTRIVTGGGNYLIQNLNAVKVWAALYDCDYDFIDYWLTNLAPDENNDYCSLDRFAYFMKTRVYLMQGKHLCIVTIYEKVKPILIKFNRKKDLCEISMILAMSFYNEKQYDKAYELIENCINVSSKYHYDRMIANEGTRMYYLLRDYQKTKSKNNYLNKLISLTREISLLYPDYLKHKQEQIEPLTKIQIDIISLMAVGRSNTEIAYFMEVSVNTVKYHIKNIFKKLNVTSRAEAITKAFDYKIISKITKNNNNDFIKEKK